MKIRLDITLNLTEEGVKAWMDEFGVSRSKVREDVRSVVMDWIRTSYHAELTDWEVKENK